MLSFSERVARAKALKAAQAAARERREVARNEEAEVLPAPLPTPTPTPTPVPTTAPARKKFQVAAPKHKKPTTPTTVSKQEVSSTSEVEVEGEIAGLDKSEVGLSHLNEQQALAVRLATDPAHKSYALIGAAGTGKTTTTKVMLEQLVAGGTLGKISEEEMKEYTSICGSKPLLQEGNYRVAVLSYTNVATRNIKSILPAGIADHCSTAHRFLAYMPVVEEYDVLDEHGLATGETKTKRTFEPSFGIEPTTDGGRGVGNGAKVPHFDVIVIEESGSMPVWLFKTILSALPDPEATQFIFLGDINQLPPAIGDGVLGYKMLELPTVELIQTYRNVGLVTKFAHRVLRGTPLSPYEEKQWKHIEDASGEVKLVPFPKKMDVELVTKQIGRSMYEKVLNGSYTVEDSVILLPFNVKFGTIEMNRWIGQAVADLNNLPVYEVQSGFETHYLCIGDRIMVNKQFYRIKDITPSKEYFGEMVRPASVFMNRWGKLRKPKEGEEEQYEEFLVGMRNMGIDLSAPDHAEDASLDAILGATASSEEERKTKTSHEIELERLDGEPDANGELPSWTLTRCADLNSATLLYALTIYKAQGSEWQNVVLILHESHAVSLCREQLYTGLTRARRSVTILHNDSLTVGTSKATINRCITRPEIKGNTLEEKLQYFRKRLNVGEYQEEMNQLKAKYSFGKK